MRLTATMKVAFASPLADDHLLPQRLGVELRVVGLGADRGRVHQHVGARQRVRPRELGEPLVPAGREADLARADLDHRKAGVAGREAQVLEIAGERGDMQLAGAGEQAAVRRHADRGVEAEVRRRPIRTARHARRRRSRSASRRASCVVGPSGIASRYLADRCREILVDREVGAQRELLEADQLRAVLGREPHPFNERALVSCGVRVPGALDGADDERRALGRQAAQRRGQRRARPVTSSKLITRSSAG